jgi:adenylate kinase
MLRASKDPEVHAKLERGELFGDDEITAVFKEALLAHKENNKIILDGYPRTLQQVNLLEDLLEEIKQTIEVVILLDLSREETIQRLLRRARKDDTEEAINNRLQQFEDETKPVIGHYQKNGLVQKVDGLGSVEDVFVRIEKVIPWR